MTTPQVLDHAITSTISRTIITHGSTQMMVLSMLVFGGETLHYFAMALTIGILLRHLLLGAGGQPPGDVAGGVPGAVHQGPQGQGPRTCQRRRRLRLSLDQQRLGYHSATSPLPNAAGLQFDGSPATAGGPFRLA